LDLKPAFSEAAQLGTGADGQKARLVAAIVNATRDDCRLDTDHLASTARRTANSVYRSS
jgi:hypothetical protein